jgi:hypothetical protein
MAGILWHSPGERIPRVFATDDQRPQDAGTLAGVFRDVVEGCRVLLDLVIRGETD